MDLDQKTLSELSNEDAFNYTSFVLWAIAYFPGLFFSFDAPLVAALAGVLSCVYLYKQRISRFAWIFTYWYRLWAVGAWGGSLGLGLLYFLASSPYNEAFATGWLVGALVSGFVIFWGWKSLDRARTRMLQEHHYPHQ